MSDHSDKDQPPPGRDRIDEIDDRLEGLYDAVSGSFRDISDRLQAAFGTRLRAGGVTVDHGFRAGPVVDDEGRVAAGPDAAQEPEHELHRTAQAWSLDCRLPGCGPLDLRLAAGPGGLVIRARGYRLDTALPADLDPARLSMRFEDGLLRLSAPRGAPE